MVSSLSSGCRDWGHASMLPQSVIPMSDWLICFFICFWFAFFNLLGWSALIIIFEFRMAARKACWYWYSLVWICLLLISLMLRRMVERTTIIRSLFKAHGCYDLRDNVSNVTVVTVPFIGILLVGTLMSSFILGLNLLLLGHGSRGLLPNHGILLLSLERIFDCFESDIAPWCDWTCQILSSWLHQRNRGVCRH